MAIFGAGRRGGANGAPDALAEAMTEPLAGAIMDAPADTAAHAPHGADGLPAPRRHAAIVAVSLGTILTTIDGSIVSVALPTLARDLHVAPSSAVLVVTIYQLVLMMTLLPFSALADRFGLRVTYQSGQIVFVVATIFCFFARSLPFLVLVRAFQALGAAAAMSVASAMIRGIYPARRLGRGLSFNTVVAAMSASLAPTLGGLILVVARWPWLFAVVVPFGIVSILIGRTTLPNPPTRAEGYDTLGAVMCAATFGLAITGLESGVHGDSPIVSAALVVLAVAVGIVFIRRQLGQARPLFPVDLLRRRTIALSAVAGLAGNLASVILLLTMPFRLQQGYGFTPAEAGAVFAPWPLTVMVVAPTSGMLSDRIPAGILGAVGMTIAIGGLGALALLPAAPGHLDIAWRIMVCGIGFGMFFSPNARQIIALAPVDRAAPAGALVSTTRGAGQTLGATAVAAILAAGLGTGGTPPLISAGLALIAGSCSVAGLVAARRGRSIATA